MDRDTFLKEQFISLREEIKDTKARMHRTIGFGLLAIPAGNFLAQNYQIEVVILTLPILIIIVSLVYLSESNALMRCGRYIRTYIETEVIDTVGWEQFLETKSPWDARATDKYLSYAFYLLFILYFAGSVWMAGEFALERFGLLTANILLSAYSMIFVLFVVLLILKMRITTWDISDLRLVVNRRGQGKEDDD